MRMETKGGDEEGALPRAALSAAPLLPCTRDTGRRVGGTHVMTPVSLGRGSRKQAGGAGGRGQA